MHFLGSDRRAERNFHSSKDMKFNTSITNGRLKERFHMLQIGSNNTKEYA